METKKIIIKTKIDSRIYESSQNHENGIEYRYNLTPRNLLAAINKLTEHRETLKTRYGSEGMGGTWLEIDGKYIDERDFDCLEYFDDSRYWNDRLRESRTSWLKRYIVENC